MRTLTRFIILMTIVMFSTSLWAEDDKDFRSWAVSGGAEHTFIENDVVGFEDINDVTGLFLAIERGYGNWGTEFSGSSAKLRNRQTGINSDFVDFSLRQLYYLNGQNRFTPYFFGGYANEDAKSPLSGDNNNLFAGVGFLAPLSENLGLWADLRKPIVDIDDRSITETSISVGIKAYLSKTSSAPRRSYDDDNDGVSNKLDQCPTTPYGATVDAKGCELDSDNDGVKNSKDLCPNSAAGTVVDNRGCEVAQDSDEDGVVDSADQCPNSPAGQKVDSTGCKLKEIETLIADLVVNFDTNSAFVKSDYNPQIQTFASFLKQYSSLVASLSGHTDNVGNFKQTEKNIAYNLALSERRVKAVQAKLLALGVPADQLIIVAKGMSTPLNSNATDAERAQNRRVTASVSIDVEK